MSTGFIASNYYDPAIVTASAIISNDQVPFRPVRGTEEKIKRYDITDGNVYFAYDTGKIFMDKDGTRISFGGGGSGSANGASIYYGTLNQKIEPEESTGICKYPIDKIDENHDTPPKVNDIILDEVGALYRIMDIGETHYECILLPLSGNGDGTLTTRPSCKLTLDNQNFIDGKPATFRVESESAKEENGEYIDTSLTVRYELYTADNIRYFQSQPIVYDTAAEEWTGELGKINVEIDFGEALQDSRTSNLKVWVEGNNHTAKSFERSAPVSSSILKLNKESGWKPTTRYPISGFSIKCNVVGSINKIVEFYYDDMKTPADIKYVSSGVYSYDVTFNVPANKATHGHHLVGLKLYQNLGTESAPRYGLSDDPVLYEIAVVDESNPQAPPVIWLGDYKDTYFNYDIIQIPYLVYDPGNTSKARVHLCKNRIEQSYRDIEDFSDYNYWEIADAELDRLNNYQIFCGEDKERRTEREISFTVKLDPTRNMVVESNGLLLNFSAVGRSNDESAARRQIWEYELKTNSSDADGTGEIKRAKFENFNWKNNGWILDQETKTSCLRISNGAQFTLPFKSMLFAADKSGSNSHTVEMQIKIKNIQSYGNLITNITRYENDDEWYEDFTKQEEYTNYDAYLQAKLTAEQYEGLKFKRVDKVINVNNVVGGLYDYNASNGKVTGFCVGTQDAFFSNGENTVNVNFVENQLINLSFVYQHGLKMLYIYINGVITGVIKSFEGASNSSFNIANTDFVFNSRYCDIDLYKLRVYNSDLNVNQIVTNFAVDRRDVDIFDQSNKYALASINQSLQEYQIQYDQVLEYNTKHPTAPLMPYIIFDTGSSSLPYSKDDKKKIKVEFINAPLEAAYLDGTLETKAREDGLISENASAAEIEAGVRTYYKHHCPSWTSSIRDDERVNFEVQGTSSEFYPRRNYKIKTKMEFANCWKDNSQLDPEDQNLEAGGAYTEDEGLNLYMHKGPYADIYNKDKDIISKDLDNKYIGYEESRLSDGWYMNNYTNATDRWTMKVDYMESSGSYNAGFASLMGNAYTKHPLKDHLNNLTGTDKLKPVISSTKYRDIQWNDYRTSLLGFPVMAFQKTNNKYIFIGYYRMLLDKSSNAVLGFKPHKDVKHKLFPDGKGGYKRVRDVVECWEYSNNARGFCSFRDPWDRVELSFLSPKGEKNEWTAKGAPVVANSFEYRYHSKDDYIDKLYDFSAQSQSDLDEVAKELGLEKGSIVAGDKYSGADALMTTHRNWEKVVKWVWSTNLDAVDSQGRYEPVLVSDTAYEPGKYYYINEQNVYEIATGAFNEEYAYFEYTQDEDETEPSYKAIILCEPANKFVENTFYYQVAGLNTSTLEDDVYTLAPSYTSGTQYYNFISDDEATLKAKFDLLVRPVDIENEVFSASTKYYTWNGAVKIKKGSTTGAVAEVSAPNEEDWRVGKYYVANPVTYAKTTYTYDTKEYRAAKFTNEFEKHFDPEYVATYFVMTEVMECYDSRGKNCMMATWGPLKEGGEYIWYPIFYDIDTQLGINNTGIPSFEFNVDATEAGNYSTSDSILWNNFYKFFKDIWMIPKYRNLRGNESKFNKLEDVQGNKTAPLQSVEYIEKWYTFDPEVTNNIACKGVRPILATNLDMYFKYITICNPEAKKEGVAHLGGEGSNGAFADPDTGTYFYALQGDRSQSRQQFIESRLDYIDSWLTQGNYARAGANRLWGRISANNRSDLDSKYADVHSDKWTESGNNYWVNGIEFGTKTHEFDAEYWLEPKPIRSSYFTAGDDSMNYPSQKYDGIHPLKFKLNELEGGIRKSNNYPEQLLYIYGTNQMSDFGDLSKMYWTEFKMEGRAEKLTRLKLGHDGLTNDYPNDQATEKQMIPWYNKKLNNITLPSNGLPLLKEANFCNITLTAEKPLDLSASQKLENFRATGSSGITGVTFAKGVALNTLYLPSGIGTLSLDEATLLTDLIGYTDKEGTVVKPYTVPNMVDGNLQATPGLYLENFFTGRSALNTINLQGGALGHNSYRLLKRLYDIYHGTNDSAYVTMTNVNWCPFVQLSEGDRYDATKTYWMDDNHYGFKLYENVGPGYDVELFNLDVLSGKLYSDSRTDTSSFDDNVLFIDDEAVQLLMNIANKNANFKNAAKDKTPEITGIIYIHNINPIEESYIKDQLQSLYPNLTFFFNSVTKGYSAQFLFRNPETGADEYVDFINGSQMPSVQKISQEAYRENNNIWFEDPFRLYEPKRTHYEFVGWSTNPLAKPTDSSIIKDSAAWSNLRIDQRNFDYTYFAIFKIHQYDITFYDGNGDTLTVVKYDYGTEGIDTPADKIPWKDDSHLTPIYMTYAFMGWSRTDSNQVKIDLSTYQVHSDDAFFPMFEEKTVYENIHPEYFEGNFATSANNSIDLSLVKKVRGKITVPATWQMDDGKWYPVQSVNSSFSCGTQAGVNFTPMGSELTHVFFALDTQVSRFKSYAFSAPYHPATNPGSQFTYSKLKYVEFPESLINIDDHCFYRACSLDFTDVTGTDVNISDWDYPPRIYGENVTVVGAQAFQQSFTNYSLQDFNIGPKVTTLGEKCFNNTGITTVRFNIGTVDSLSQLNLDYASDLISNIPADMLYFYSARYDQGDLSNQATLFQKVKDFDIK